MGKVLQLEAKRPWKMGNRYNYELYGYENESMKYQTMKYFLCEIESNVPLQLSYTSRKFCTVTMIFCVFDTYCCNNMQLMIAVQQSRYSLLFKQERREQTMIDKNEICKIKMLNTYTCSYNTSFMVRLLLIIDGDVESNPGPTYESNPTNIKKLVKVRADQKKGFHRNLQESDQCS